MPGRVDENGLGRGDVRGVKFWVTCIGCYAKQREELVAGVCSLEVTAPVEGGLEGEMIL